MARISLPQMADATIFTSTCPCCGRGMGTSRNSTVLLPGRIAPRITTYLLVGCAMDASPEVSRAVTKGWGLTEAATTPEDQAARLFPRWRNKPEAAEMQTL